MRLYRDCAGAVIRVPDVNAVSVWICKNLLFEEIGLNHDRDSRTLINGNCVLYLVLCKSFPEKKLFGKLPDKKRTETSYCTGLAHVALHAAEINEAIKWCRSRNLDIVLDGNKSFYNPRVFGEGERYFNIRAPFGITFEVSEQIGNPVKQEEQPIHGLDHLGIPCADINQEIRFLKKRGFVPLFDLIYNYNEAEGHIACQMVSDGMLTLEVYRFLDRDAYRMTGGEALAGIACSDVSVDSPGGVHFLNFIEAGIQDE